MRIALACLKPTENTAQNVRLLLHSLDALEDSADLIVFGKRFLNDEHSAPLEAENPLFEAVCEAARRYHTGISFGFCERTLNGVSDVQLVIGPDGKILCKMKQDETAAFSLGGKSFVLSECEEAATTYPAANAVLWPLSRTYNPTAWNSVTKFDYMRRASQSARQVLLVNTPGGALHTQDGRIRLELPCGEQGYLFANL